MSDLMGRLENLKAEISDTIGRLRCIRNAMSIVAAPDDTVIEGQCPVTREKAIVVQVDVGKMQDALKIAYVLECNGKSVSLEHLEERGYEIVFEYKRKGIDK